MPEGIVRTVVGAAVAVKVLEAGTDMMKTKKDKVKVKKVKKIKPIKKFKKIKY